jgi:hypothetical protein
MVAALRLEDAGALDEFRDGLRVEGLDGEKVFHGQGLGIARKAWR